MILVSGYIFNFKYPYEKGVTGFILEKMNHILAAFVTQFRTQVFIIVSATILNCNPTL